MAVYTLRITLRSDAAFGRGDGVAGLVDTEVEHDARTGLPQIGGKTVKGLLVEECANIFHSLRLMQSADSVGLWETGQFLFGRPGSGTEDQGRMTVGTASFPVELRRAVEAEIAARRLTPAEVLEACTSIRRQSAIDDQSGASKRNMLRSLRVVVRGTELQAPLTLPRSPRPEDDLALLSACVLGLRRGGATRNRGRGRLEGRLVDSSGVDITADSFERFTTLAREVAA